MALPLRKWSRRASAGALADALRQPIVWVPALSLVIVLFGVTVPQALDNFLSLLGGAAGGVGLFTTGSCCKRSGSR